VSGEILQLRDITGNRETAGVQVEDGAIVVDAEIIGKEL
jgi:hypothetical protein